MRENPENRTDTPQDEFAFEHDALARNQTAKIEPNGLGEWSESIITPDDAGEQGDSAGDWLNINALH